MSKYLKCGRAFSEAEIDLIRETVRENYSLGRCAISRIVCQRLGWVSENGKSKAWICREFLIQLRREGLIKLPQPDPRSFNRLKKKQYNVVFKEPEEVLQGRLGDFSRPAFKRVSSRADNTLWEHLVARHHYLGFKGVMGRYMKYLVYIEQLPIAALGWTGGAWKVAARDRWIGWDDQTRQKKLKHVVNNFRFVLFPWVSIKYLASHLLSKNVPILVNDWQQQYNVPILLLETFVEKDRFAGTCYKAANWIHVGETKGYGKTKQSHIRHGIIKQVYVYKVNRQGSLV